MPYRIDRRHFLGATAAGLATTASALLPLSALAQQDYPNRPVRIVVGFPAGGGTDVFARALAQALAASMGQQFIVDNKAGAGGVVASQAMLQTPADGYTMSFSSMTPSKTASGMSLRAMTSLSAPSAPTMIDWSR